MEKKRKVIQVYALIVCIVAIITFIISVSILVSSIIDRSDPLYSSCYSKTDLSSFENFKMDKLGSFKENQTYMPSDQELRNAYEAAKEEKIKRVLHNTLNSIVVTSILILICLILYFTHWWMIKKYGKDEEIPAVASP
ncbi:MAG: hypothetical protein K8S00_09665 [Bacteroidales bacterium]|nr:hypothetical protein [Bacteroidales bacterium]